MLRFISLVFAETMVGIGRYHMLVTHSPMQMGPCMMVSTRVTTFANHNAYVFLAVQDDGALYSDDD